MKYIVINFVAATLFFSCNTKTTSETTQQNAAQPVVTDTVSTAEKLNGCYAMNIGKDSASLQLTVKGTQATGNLSYKRFEKDSNDGTIEGIFKDGKIRAWYRFKSEGSISVREVCFNIKGETLIEGYGEMQQNKDTAYFKYPNALSYEENHPYIKTNCQ